MKFPQAFFALNFRFAERVAEVTSYDLETALLRCTHLYLRFGLGRAFDSKNSLWQEYLAGLRDAVDQVAWTYQFYLRQYAREKAPAASPFGCFSYAVWSEQRIRIHFHNADPAPWRPLSRTRMHVRLLELQHMFAHICTHVPEATTVIGGSWLYNIDAYRRLFPPEFSASAYQGKDELQFMLLWGQFLTWDGQIKQATGQAFAAYLSQQYTMAELEVCFPYAVLRVESPITMFYHYYHVMDRDL